MQNFLFICSRNKWRSPTAEKIWQRSNIINTRSAGTSPNAKRVVSVKDVEWADVIFVMEEKHKNRLKAKFTRLLDFKEIVVLDVPDDFGFMDKELVELLEDLMAPYLA